MAKISDIDKNLEVKGTIDKEGIRWIPVNRDLFAIYGLLCDEQGFRRMDTEVAKQTSPGVSILYSNTAGGRIAMETDSPYVALNMKAELCRMPHMPVVGSAGFDLYLDEGEGFFYFKSFIPNIDDKDGFDSLVELGDKKMRKILIHFPLYSNVDELYMGLDENASLNKLNPYKDKKPVVYYGSSITQGGCASRPGNNYSAIASLKTGVDFTCLGFSGNAHGERVMAEYIASLPMSVFVMDYTYNDASNPEFQARHAEFYRIIREKNPDLPIVIMTAPYSSQGKSWITRTHDCALENYKKAKADGDNVYFVDGNTYLGEEYWDCATVDGCHPNDFGFVKMADAVIQVLTEIFEK